MEYPVANVKKERLSARSHPGLNIMRYDYYDCTVTKVLPVSAIRKPDLPPASIPIFDYSMRCQDKKTNVSLRCGRLQSGAPLLLFSGEADASPVHSAYSAICLFRRPPRSFALANTEPSNWFGYSTSEHLPNSIQGQGVTHRRILGLPIGQSTTGLKPGDFWTRGLKGNGIAISTRYIRQRTNRTGGCAAHKIRGTGFKQHQDAGIEKRKMDPSGVEPLISAMRMRRSPN